MQKAPQLKRGTLRRFTVAALGALVALAAPMGHAQTTLAGVRYEATVQVRGAGLQLNGAGIRYRGPFKVYAAGLYLTQKAATPEGVFAASGPKRLSITMLREIDSNELGKLFSRAVEDNMDKGAFAKLVPSVIRMGEIFAEHKKLATGESFEMDWQPGVGTVIAVKGKVQGEPFKEPEFYTALLRIWLGPKPADRALKDALLGKPG